VVDREQEDVALDPQVAAAEVVTTSLAEASRPKGATALSGDALPKVCAAAGAAPAVTARAAMVRREERVRIVLMG
jgi:hypothetical protein